MTDFLQFALLGLGTGAVYALLGQGLVLIFRGSGVLNLAHGAFAMLGAFLFFELHAQRGMATAPAIVLTVLTMAAIGALVDQLVLRRLRGAAPLSRLIATLGVLVVVQSAAVLIWGSEPQLIAPLLAQSPVDVLGATVSSDRLWLLVIAVVLTAVLAAVWRWTRVGWVLSAVAENQRAAAALGCSPEVASASTWALGAGLAGLAGLLIAPITQLSVAGLSLIVIPGLAAALIGGFRSFPLTLAGGLALGIAQSETQNYTDLTGAATSVPFLVIVVVLALRGSSLPTRGVTADRLPAVGSGRLRPVVVALATAVAVAAIGLLLSDEAVIAVSAGLATALVLLSVVVLTGYSGQLSLAQFALAGVGALIAARAVEAGSFPFALAALLGMLGAAVSGLVFALPALRTRGVELAAVTLGLGAAAQAMLFNNSDVTGSSAGTPVGDPSLFGLSLAPFEHPQRYALLCLAAFVVCAVAVKNLRRGRSGRRMLAVRTNERAAAAVGIGVFRTKLHAFALGGALAGLGGVLLAFRSSTVIYTDFQPLRSITAVAEAVIGGIGYVTGPLLGAVLAPGSVGEHLSGSDEASAADWLPLISGVVLLLLLIVAPDGLARALRRLGYLVLRRDQAAPVPADIAAAAPTVVPPRTLTVRDLTVRYGGVTAVEDLRLEVRPGQVVGLIGPNGAGKTSAVDAISGFTRASGTVQLGDAAIGGWAPHRRARAGLVRSFQALELFEDLDVHENLLAAEDDGSASAMATDLVRPGRPALSDAAGAAVRAFGLEDVLDRRPSELPYGQRRLVAVARAVASRPSVLLLDEPAAGLDDHESREFATLVRRLADEWGIGVLVIEHDLEFVMSICDELVVLEFGRTISRGTPDEVRRDPRAVAAYLGEEPTAPAVLEAIR